MFRHFSVLVLNSNVYILFYFHLTTPIACWMSKNVLFLGSIGL